MTRAYIATAYLLATWFLRVPAKIGLAALIFLYEFYVVPDSEQVELTAADPEVAGTLMAMIGMFMAWELASRTGLARCYKTVWSQIHSGTEYGRRLAPRYISLSIIKLLHEIEDNAPLVAKLVLALPAILTWHLLLLLLRKLVPPLKQSVTHFWLGLNSRVYGRLDSKQPTIRLLHLAPGLHDEPVVCSLAEADVQNSNFEAISYAWGGHLVLRRKILVDGLSFFVTENMLKALKYLRLESATRTLWIDQICINQSDHVEKTDQVTHKMHHVYSNANQVIAWLGVGKPQYDYGWAFRRAIECPGKPFDDIEEEKGPCGGEEPKAPWYMAPMGRLLSLGLPRDLKGSQSESEETRGQENKHLRHYEDVWLDVFCRKWFTRIWVVQETALARRLRVKCGDAEISWDELKRTASDLRRMYRFNPSVHARALMEFAGHTNHQEQAELLGLAIRFRKYGSSDPRDKLIGLLALANDGRQFSEVNYLFHNRSVFANFSESCIQRSQSLEILALAEIHDQYDMFPETSACSWALDWGSHETDIYQPAVLWGARLEKSHIAEVARYSACGHRPAVYRREEGPPIPPLVRGIFLRGWHVDTVDAVSVRGSRWDRSMLTVLPIWKEFVLTRMPLRTCLEDKFQRIITGEVVPSPNDTPWGGWYIPQDERDSEQDGNISTSIRQASLLLESLCHGRRLFVTSRGRLGIGPPGTSVGDEICIVEGSAVPFVLRRWQDASRWIPGGYFSRRRFDHRRPYCYVGQAAVNDLMYATTSDLEKKIAASEITLKEIWLR